MHRDELTKAIDLAVCFALTNGNTIVPSELAQRLINAHPQAGVDRQEIERMIVQALSLLDPSQKGSDQSPRLDRF